jgi:hypothetical protein
MARLRNTDWEGRTMREFLHNDGWQSPNTYDGRVYAEIPDAPGVYLMLCFEAASMAPRGVGYVGSSIRLARRLMTHNVRPKIERDGYWTQLWFKRLPAHSIRSVEKAYIEALDPAYNVIGRPRGLPLRSGAIG